MSVISRQLSAVRNGGSCPSGESFAGQLHGLNGGWRTRTDWKATSQCDGADRRGLAHGCPVRRVVGAADRNVCWIGIRPRPVSDPCQGRHCATWRCGVTTARLKLDLICGRRGGVVHSYGSRTDRDYSFQGAVGPDFPVSAATAKGRYSGKHSGKKSGSNERSHKSPLD